MLSEQEKNVINEKIRLLQKDLRDLKTKLNSINDQKESWFKKKEELKTQIKNRISNVKQLKGQDDKGYEDIKILKQQRDKYNSEVKNLIGKIKELNNEKAIAFKKYKVKIDPNVIQSRIEDIERRLETEVSFENEKKLRKELKRLKKANEEGMAIKSLLDKIKELSNSIIESKKKADEFHGRIIESSKQKNTSYSEFIDLSREINDLRKTEEEAFQKFISFKKEFAEVNAVIKNKLKELSDLKAKVVSEKEREFANKEATFKNRLVEKTKEVWEKFRSKKKLTTEDIILLQGKDK